MSVTVMSKHRSCPLVPAKGMSRSAHTGDFPRGVGHRVEKGWGLTKCAVVLLNDIIMVKIPKIIDPM